MPNKIIASTFNLMDQRTEMNRGSFEYSMYRTAHVIFNSIRSPQFSWEHFNTPSGPPNVVLPSAPITIRASLTDGTNVWPIYFSGQSSATIVPGGELWCDPIPVEMTKGSTWYCQTAVTAPAGSTWYTYRTANVPVHGNNEYMVGGTSTILDYLALPYAPVTVYQGQSLYRPSKLIGVPVSSSAAAYLMIGDSNMAGSADSWGGDNLSLGFTNNILDTAGVASLNRAIPGDTCTNFIQFANHRIRGHEYCTNILLALGTNDTVLSAFSTPDQYIRVLDHLSTLGKPITCLTVPPRSVTNSGGVQTPDTNVLTRRNMINKFIRSKGHPAINDVWDVSAIIEDPAKPGTYRAMNSAGELPVAGDMLHYTRAGVRWIVQNGAPMVNSAKSMVSLSQTPAIRYAELEKAQARAYNPTV